MWIKHFFMMMLLLQHSCMGFNNNNYFNDLRNSLRARCKTTYRETSFENNTFWIEFYKDKVGGCNHHLPFQRHNAPNGFKKASLEYEVFFPKNHTWGKGGKMHGLISGETFDHRISGLCVGGARQNTCHSFRIMWNPKGMIEMYLYVGHQLALNICNQFKKEVMRWSCKNDSRFGLTIFRNSGLTLQKEMWNKVVITEELGVGATSNISITLNNKTIGLKGLQLQPTNTHSIKRAMFTVFYGGHTPDWYPLEDTIAFFKNFRIFDYEKADEIISIRNEL